MKRLIIILLFINNCIGLIAQSVGIGNINPDVNAILDLSNNGKGLLLPKLSMAQRDQMVNPPTGMIVYMVSTSDAEQPIGLYYRYSGGWKYIMSKLDIEKTWQKTTDGQYSMQSNVGIGINDPSAPLHIRKEGAFPLIRLDGGQPSIYFSTGNAQDGYNGTGRIFASGNDLVIGGALGSSNKRIVFQLSGENKASLEPDGTFKTKSEIRLTDAAFTEKAFMQMNGDDFRIGTVSANNTGSFVIRTNGADRLAVNAAGDVIPAGNLQFNDGLLQKAFIQRNGDDLRLGTNSDNATGEVVVRMAGNDRFKFEKSGRISLMADLNPTIYFNTGGVTQAFLQVQGNNLRISATSNKVYINNDLTVDDATGRVGIGTVSPEQTLHVQGVAKVTSAKILNNSNENLLPYGYAVFNVNGTKASGTANLGGGWIGNDFMLDPASGDDITSATIFITCRNGRLMPSYFNDNGRIQINFFDSSGDTFRTSFSVVVYKTN